MKSFFNSHPRLDLAFRVVACIAVLALLAFAARWQWPALRSPAAAASADEFRKVEWDALLPPGFDPMKGIDLAELRGLDDRDPKAAALLARLQRAWDEAPAVPEMDDQKVMLPGFVVPLEGQRNGIREFLLVPYFGACIHTPPPPANQIVHVVLRDADFHIQSMSPVWVQGILTVKRTRASREVVASASYRLHGKVVATYHPRSRSERRPAHSFPGPSAPASSPSR